MANELSGNVSVMLGNGFSSFGNASNFVAGGSPQSVAVGDFNGDGRPDLAVANFSSNNVSVLLNNTVGNPMPLFTMQPVGQVAQSGASVSFIAAANFPVGASPYQWRRNGLALADGGNISGSTTPTLTINPVSASDEAVYDLRVTSSTCLGVQTSNPAVLAVTAPAATGACCQGTTCTVTIGAAACSGGGTYLGDGTTCAPIGRSGAMNACCQADFNSSGATSVQDIFDFLNAWFAGCP